jgi:heterodisulfide reductase subunit A
VRVPDPASGGLGTRSAIGIPYPGALPHVAALDRDACLRSRGEACDLCARACPFGAVRLEDAEPETRTLTVGAVVLATGMRPGEVTGPLGVVSTRQLERMLHPDGPTGGAVRTPGGGAPRSVLLAADGGAGELAAREVLKLARLLRARLPAARVAVAGGLDRIPSLAADCRALEGEGVALLAGAPLAGGIERLGEELRVRLADGAAIRAELVALHPPERPAEGTDALAALFRIATGERGFLADGGASPFEPTATRIAGVYVAGAAAGPRPLREAIRDGAAAAGRVHAALVPGERRPLEPLAARIDAALCSGCAVCAAACPFGAVELADGKASVVRVHCRACGTCVAACPTGAASAPHFTRAQIAAEISALLAAPGAKAEQ